ncbi:MAG: UDP-N-acetylmuramoyl-tripeptide--D-alanyl-D-alanine ligase [Paludibacteraceae bacterium]|nr:UDP-N-acetylmuramoyl-tripeptide--D-alanyl-D-alanine ligase [Paludibacteraceae bacterium]
MDWSFLINDKSSLNVTTDSRKITDGCVFVALKGENFDGNTFALKALEQGASMAIVDDEEVYNTILASGEYSALLVENSLLALQDLAREWRRYLGTRIIGITGTNGKTTTKELLAAVLSTRYKTHYTQGNLNNSIGVPLTVLQLTKEHELAIVEMGASHPGDIKELVEVAEPNFGLITNVGKAHLQGFGSFEGVMRTKAELYDYILAHGGTIFRNADNPHLEQMLKDSASQLVNCQLSIVNYSTGTMPEGTHLVGAYNSENIQAALCVGEFFGVDRESGLAAIRAYVPSNNRSQKTVTEKNTLIIDAYNANPTSMTAAIQAFDSSLTAKQSNSVSGLTSNSEAVYILGAMRELGEYSHTEHQNIVNMLLERKADKVLLVGDEYRETTAPYPIFSNVDELCEHLKSHPITGCTILIKGSRSNKLEQVIPLL